MSLTEAMTFVKAWTQHPAMIGAISPSSQYLARQMVRGLNPRPGEVILEFGPGTGPFTRAIVPLLPDTATYIGIERESRFVKLLRTKFPELCFVHSSAEHAPQLLGASGLGRVRAVICGLPFASFAPSVQDDVIQALNQVMQPGCEFRTFQYVHAYVLPTAVRYRRRMDSLFGRHQCSRAVMRNLPPAFVLTWQRQR